MTNLLERAISTDDADRAAFRRDEMSVGPFLLSGRNSLVDRQ
jgi:hypothetical protein